jgi:hypothetical protein
MMIRKDVGGVQCPHRRRLTPRYVADFIREARAGGCASGTPPINLGFRVVRASKSVLARVASVFRKPDFGGLAGARS